MLIKCAGKWILTDPVFFDVIGVRILGIPMGLRRNTPPALPFDALPKPDLVLLSHAHIDHADLPTLEALTRHYPHELTLVTAKNTTDVMECMNWGNILELDWNQDHTFDGVNIRALPVIHNGGRMPFDRDRANGYKKTGRSYNAYRIAGGGMSAVFGGDTAYTPAFKHLAEEGGVDVAMMPIGAYRHYEHLHCTPEQSLQMADEMEARYFVPMHCMTFRQSEEPPAEPLERLQAAAPNAHTQIAFTHIGHTLTLFGDSATEQARMPLAANE
jgi:L-ascorbate metabolism protein UlaG (beta-lactamase superfamily)